MDFAVPDLSFSSCICILALIFVIFMFKTSLTQQFDAEVEAKIVYRSNVKIAEAEAKLRSDTETQERDLRVSHVDGVA